MFHISSADNPNIFFMSVVVYYAIYDYEEMQQF